MENLLKKWLLVSSVDSIGIDYEDILYSVDEPDFWTYYSIVESHGCAFFDLYEYEEID